MFASGARALLMQVVTRTFTTPLGVALALAALVAAAVHVAAGPSHGELLTATIAGPADTGDAASRTVRRGHVTLTQSSFTDDLARPEFWAARKSGSGTAAVATTAPASSPAQPSVPATFDTDDNGNAAVTRQKSRRPDGDSAERTLCVRLCDGFYWPVTYGTGPGSYDEDEKACQSSCTAPTRLFVARGGDDDVGAMRDLDGKPYSKLEKAFAYRTTYNADCKCKPHPWEQASRDLHRVYALSEAKGKPSRQTAAEIAELAQNAAKAMPPATRKVLAGLRAGGRVGDTRVAAGSGRKQSKIAVVLDGEEGENAMPLSGGKSARPDPWANQRMGLNARADKPAPSKSSDGGGKGPGGRAVAWQRSAFSGGN